MPTLDGMVVEGSHDVEAAEVLGGLSWDPGRAAPDVSARRPAPAPHEVRAPPDS
ncbi:hypothetical protein [Streptomyces pactum]|uniref:hypothetical protein n=1 Tax=Streptomyces pactum TaxID=68249 RepID=UPI0027DBFA9B|nr:hypothetical protein [Streptomyces pactum]